MFGSLDTFALNATGVTSSVEAFSHLSNPSFTKSISNFVGAGKFGAATVEIGSEALIDQHGNALFSESSHVLHAAVSAIRDPMYSDHKSEIIITALAVWGMIEDIPDSARLNLSSLLEALAATVDQTSCCHI